MKLGIESVAYRNSATWGTPTWDAMPGISDLTVNAKWDSGDGSSRASKVKMSQVTQLDLSVSAKHIVDASTDYTELSDAFWAGDELDIMILDGASTANGSEGVRFMCQLHDFTESQGLGDVLYRQIEFKPTVQTANFPQTVLVTAGAPVFTTIA